MKKLTDGLFPAIPDGWLPSVKELLKQCWQKNPDSRPSFDKVESSLKANSFQVVSGVDADAVQLFVDSVERDSEE
jgi:hypothetical protein